IASQFTAWSNYDWVTKISRLALNCSRFDCTKGSSVICLSEVMRRKITNKIREQIKTACASGIGLREIVRNIGIPEGTVLARAKREGWTHEIQSAKALAQGENETSIVTPVEAVAMSMP